MRPFGTIVKPQGVRGELKVRPVLQGEESTPSVLFIGGVSYPVTALAFREGFCYCSLQGVGDRNAAEALRGRVLETELPRPPLEAGTYYVDDLVGSAVIAGAAVLGRVTAVDALGAADVITIATPNGNVRVPHLKKLVISFSADAKLLALDPVVLEQVAVYED
ncbi:MAG: hypothetical protein LBM78_00405 [Clostridiales bacterium]|jgi:16S rRNA processing protein RimM|nr:hypothetical protein [Clostridiales bacterium]